MHTLRHTFVTRMITSGIPISEVAHYVGHASAKMTLDVYGHDAEDGTKAMIEAIRKEFSKKLK